MSTRALLVAALLVVAGGAAHAETATPCESPRAAARQFLDNLQPDQMLPQAAIRCFTRPAGMSDAELIHRVRQLKAVLDHRGLYVVMDDLSAEPAYKDAQERHRATLVAGFEAADMRRVNGEWRFPESTVQAIPRLYADTFSGWVETLLLRLPPVLERPLLFGFALWQLIGLALLVAIAYAVSRVLRLLVQSRMVRILKRLDVDTTAEALAGAAKPLGLLAAAGVVALGLPELRLSIGTARVLWIAVRVVAAVAGVVLAYRVVDLFSLRLEARAARTASRMDDQLVVVVRKTLRVVVVAVGAMFVLQNLHVDVTSLLAGLGIGGLALALAAKDTAANLFGSLTIFIDAPFYVGDWIKAAGVEGTVVEIGLRSTRVRTFYDSIVSVPNSVLATSNIDNMSRRTYRRYSTKLCIGYHSSAAQVQAFVEGIRAIIAGHPDTRKDYYEVHFVEFGESWLEVMLYVFFDVSTWSAELEARHQLLIEIKRLAADLGVEFAFPTRTLHIDSHAQPVPRDPGRAPEEEALAATVTAFGPAGARAQPRGERLTHGFFANQNSRRGGDEN